MTCYDAWRDENRLKRLIEFQQQDIPFTKAPHAAARICSEKSSSSGGAEREQANLLAYSEEGAKGKFP